MELEQITLTLFTACNAVRVFAYLPQIYRAAVDKNGASGISFTTWTLFLFANLSTVAYALVNRCDVWLAISFAANAVGCVAILGVAWWKSRRSAAMALI